MLDRTPADGDPDVVAIPDIRDSNPYQAELGAALEGQGVDVCTVDGQGLLLPITRAVVGAGRPSVVHLHFITPYMAVEDDRLEAAGLATVCAVLLGLRLVVDLALTAVLSERVVWTAHNLRSHRGRSVRAEFALKHVFVRYLCDAVVIHCEAAGDALIETFRLPETAARKMVVVPHGHFLDVYPDETTRSAARAELDLPQDATVVLFFGWIRRYKNVTALMEVFADIERPDVRLVVAGNPETEALDREVRSLAARDTRIHTTLEFIPEAAVQTYMRAADLAVLPHRTGEQSLLTSGSVILAMGFGQAVVAPRIGCIDALLTGCRSDGSAPVPATERATGASGGGRRVAHNGSNGAVGDMKRSSTPTDRQREPTDGDGGVGVSAVPGGVLYDSIDQLEPALRTAFDCDLQRMGERNRAHAESLDWDGIATRMVEVYGGRTEGVPGRSS